MSRTAIRSLHSTARSFSHIGSSPIPIPSSVSLTLPPLSISPTLPASSPAAQRSVTVSGPLGSHSIPIRSPIILSSPSQSTPSSSSSTTSLNVSVHDVEEKSQRALWGLTRTLIKNAIVGVSTGYSTDIRLVGVGYRATVEPIPPVFQKLNQQLSLARQAAKTSQFSSMNTTATAQGDEPLPINRLNMKLGYAHPILIDIPHGITVEIPAPTQIVLKGTDKQKLGLFAAKIRRFRKPEPYRGKGIFVNGETIKLKEIKKK